MQILGIGGTFMASLALLAKALGVPVHGLDKPLYPPMDGLLRAAGIPVGLLREGQLAPIGEDIVIGNVMRRGDSLIEQMLDEKRALLSGPAWLAEHVLKGRQVLAVSGTHGKTTTSSMLAWILEEAGLAPGFLIGGIPKNFGVSARLGESAYFVIEADEYDSAFFDKRSKFIHYRPDILIINNLEFDHSDIFDNLAAIQQQFHHMIRMMPRQALIVHPNTAAIQNVLSRGLWSQSDQVPAPNGWSYQVIDEAGAQFIISDGQEQADVNWSLLGEHNIQNALNAARAASAVGVSLTVAARALTCFAGVARRMECKGQYQGAQIWDDFAHHPTAIAYSVQNGLHLKNEGRLIIVVDIRSNTMKAGHHQATLAEACRQADLVYFLSPPDCAWPVEAVRDETTKSGAVFYAVEPLLHALKPSLKAQDCVLFMSNGALSGSQLIA